MTPKRIQRKRTKGWKIPSNTVYVGRGTKWGNPFQVGESAYFMLASEGLTFSTDFIETPIENTHLAKSLYSIWIDKQIKRGKLDISELKGRNLACWCTLDSPCHADVLLKMANQKGMES